MANKFMKVPITFSSDHSSSLNITDLSDNLLEEILIRLPDCKSVSICKVVSKRWLHLISNASFIGQFIKHHYLAFPQHYQQEEQGKQSGSMDFLSKHCMAILYSPFTLEKHMSVSFLGLDFHPAIESTDLYSKIIGCSNGLVLCRTSESLYFVCNPITKERIQLPPPPVPICFKLHDRVLGGLICEPYFCLEQGEEKIGISSSDSSWCPISTNTLPTTKTQKSIVVNVNTHQRLWVVFIRCIRRVETEFNVEVFSFETGQWNTSLVSIPEDFDNDVFYHDYPIVSNGRKLYFRGMNNILVYDLFDNQCHTLKFPTSTWFANGYLQVSSRYLGTCCGNLRLAEVSNIRTHPVFLHVWEKKETDAHWHLLHKICLPLKNECLPVCLWTAWCLQVVAFHPFDRRVFYFQHHGGIFAFNLKTMEFQRINSEIQDLLRILPIDFLLWPTPIPSLPK